MPYILFKRETAPHTSQMKVAQAIRSIELFRGAKLVRRYKHYNCDTNRHETCYVFRSEDSADTWTADCISELRAEACKLEKLWS